jgi:transketolase
MQYSLIFHFVQTGVEVCTGPLGQGISNAAGLAIAERHMAATFNQPGTKYDALFDHYTFVICGDGCLQEGVSAEAGSLAGHLGLGRLIVLYDDNSITIDGETELSFTENVLGRYEAYGWHTQTVTDVESNLANLRAAIQKAKEVTDKPSIIKIKTHIGFGSPSKQGLESAHGAPLGKDDLAGAKKFFGLPPDKSFYVPPEVQVVFDAAAARGDAKRKAWESLFAGYAKEFPEQALEISRRFARKLPDGLLDRLPRPVAGKDKDLATRQHSQACLAAVGPHMLELIGGSADLTPSNLTHYGGISDFQKDPSTHAGRYFRFGIREHAMVSVCNGMFAHGGVRPYCATFLVFTGYALGAIRLSALSKFGIIFVMTHDSIGLGEDGPTHQPIEALETLRSMPNMMLWRPADGNETSAAYKVALERHTTPSTICASRTALPNLEKSTVEKAAMGAYAALEEDSPDLIVIATGSEVGFCVDAVKHLVAAGIKTRLVSMPCQEVFLEQSISYQRELLPGDVPTLSVEAAAVHGWHRFSHAQIGMTSFGASGAGNDLFAHFGFTPENIFQKGKELVEFYKDAGTVPNLNLRPVFASISSGH